MPAERIRPGEQHHAAEAESVALEHARAVASKALEQAGAVMLAVYNTPFGDVVDTEDDLQPLVASTFRDARRAIVLVDAALRAAEFDVARLESRAAEGGTTLTELADHLVRQHRFRSRPRTPLPADC